MKIAIVTGSYWPYTGGVNRVVKQVYEGLVKMGYEITIYTTIPSYELYKVLKFSRIKGITIRNYLSFTFFDVHGNPSPLMLLDILKDQYDILHVHNIHNPTAVVGYMAATLKKNSNLVVSPYYHGSGHSTLANALWYLYKPIARKALQYSSIIIVNSKTQYNLITHQFRISEDKIRLIYDGVDVERIRNTPPIYTGDSKIILAVSRIEKYKNVHIGIYALEHLPKNFKYVIIGEGPFLDKVRKIIAENGLKERVLLLGSQPDDVVWGWLRASSVFLHLSEKESFGMTCLEALAAGTPVIANDDHLGLRETAKLFPEFIKLIDVKNKTAKELSEIIIEMSEMKPINVDLTCFSWDYITNQYNKIYIELNSGHVY